jgi:hypothetical protein
MRQRQYALCGGNAMITSRAALSKAFEELRRREDELPSLAQINERGRPDRFRGTCYRAANRVLMGRTTRRGKDDLTHRQNRSIKEVLGLPLTRRLRELLGQ